MRTGSIPNTTEMMINLQQLSTDVLQLEDEDSISMKQELEYTQSNLQQLSHEMGEIARLLSEPENAATK